jgi:two-component system, response regulator PdtaR
VVRAHLSLDDTIIVPSYRCLIVEDDSLVALGLQSQLEQIGHLVVGTAAQASDAEELFTRMRPDLVLTDIRLHGDADGLELAQRLLKIRACPIIITSAYCSTDLVERAKNAGVFGYLIKPISEESLRAQIEVSVARFREHMILLAEKETLATTLETRKLLDRAKGVYMKHLKISEPEAHKRLQQESQKRRMNLSELARKVIESEEFLGD